MVNQPSEQEIQQAAEILSRLENGFIPEPIFHQVTRISTSAILEIIPLRKVGNDVEVLLLKRKDTDPNWPRMMHTPGTVIRSNDTLGSAYERIMNEELRIKERPDMQFVKHVLHKVKRGNELAIVYFMDVSNLDIQVGEFHNVDNLPENIVDTQVQFIRESAGQFAFLNPRL